MISAVPDSHDATDQISKVAAVTLFFWILKIVTTTAGDLSGDLLSITLGLGYVTALVVVLAAMAILLAAQFRAKRLYPVLYWALILISSAIGAEVSDAIDRALRWGNPAGAGALLACLLVILAIWQFGRGAIRVYPVSERKDEVFYWTAVILANSLGSVLGDLLGDRLGLSLLGGISVNAGVLALLLALHYSTRINKALLFWTAFVFTRISF